MDSYFATPPSPIATLDYFCANIVDNFCFPHHLYFATQLFRIKANSLCKAFARKLKFHCKTRMLQNFQTGAEVLVISRIAVGYYLVGRPRWLVRGWLQCSNARFVEYEGLLAPHRGKALEYAEVNFSLNKGRFWNRRANSRKQMIDAAKYSLTFGIHYHQFNNQ